MNGPRPYDNVIFPAFNRAELASGGDFEVVNLIDAMRVSWFEDNNTPYPGDIPYNHNTFKQVYSDHHPIVFRLRVSGDDD